MTPAPWSEGEEEGTCGEGRMLLCGGFVSCEGGLGSRKTRAASREHPGCVVTAPKEPPGARPHVRGEVRAHGSSARNSQRRPPSEHTLEFYKSLLHLVQSHFPELVGILCPAPHRTPPHRPPCSPLNLPGNASPRGLGTCAFLAYNSLYPQHLAPSLHPLCPVLSDAAFSWASFLNTRLRGDPGPRTPSSPWGHGTPVLGLVSLPSFSSSKGP